MYSNKTFAAYYGGEGTKKTPNRFEAIGSFW